MIHHISIDAHNPLQVAIALAEIWHGKVYEFLVPGSYLIIPYDRYGSHIVVFKDGDVWTPGKDADAAKVRQTVPPHFVASHAAISVPATQQQIEQIAQREGWRVLTRNKGKAVPFSVVEFWVENRLLFEFLPPEFVPQYLQTMQPGAIKQMMGQPIQSITA